MIRLLHVSISPGTFLLLLSEILLVSGSFVLATYLLAEVDPTDYLLHNYGLIAIGLITFTFILGLHFHDLYTQIPVKSRVQLLQQLCMVTGVAFLVQGLISYLSSDLRIPVRVMLTGSALAILAIFTWRLLFGTLGVPIMPKTKLLLVGGSPVLMKAAAMIQEHPDLGLEITGHVPEGADAGAMPGVPVLGSIESLREIVKAARPSRVVLGLSRKPDARLSNDLLEIRFGGYDIESAGITYERAFGRVCVYDMQPEQVVYSSTFGFAPQHVAYVGLLNGLLATAGGIVALPGILLTTLALRVLEPGPVFSRRTLAGLNGKPFRACQFAADGKTWVSRLVKRFGIHKLPLLLNVMKGEMAIVGPEAECPLYVDALAEYIPYYRERYTVRPGMTGWAQTHVPAGSIEDTMAKLEYDLYYIKNISIGLDTLILLHTLKSLFVFPEAQLAESWDEARLA
jgi:lipopolysaccharide/colanic/teichoic acid biosynthesis glycosyltransferase